MPKGTARKWFILHVDVYNHRWWLHTEDLENEYPEKIIFKVGETEIKTSNEKDKQCPVCDGANMWLEGTYLHKSEKNGIVYLL